MSEFEYRGEVIKMKVIVSLLVTYIIFYAIIAYCKIYCVVSYCRVNMCFGLLLSGIIVTPVNVATKKPHLTI